MTERRSFVPKHERPEVGRNRKIDKVASRLARDAVAEFDIPRPVGDPAELRAALVGVMAKEADLDFFGSGAEVLPVEEENAPADFRLSIENERGAVDVNVRMVVGNKEEYVNAEGDTVERNDIDDAFDAILARIDTGDLETPAVALGISRKKVRTLLREVQKDFDQHAQDEEARIAADDKPLSANSERVPSELFRAHREHDLKYNVLGQLASELETFAVYAEQRGQRAIAEKYRAALEQVVPIIEDIDAEMADQGAAVPASMEGDPVARLTARLSDETSETFRWDDSVTHKIIRKRGDIFNRVAPEMLQ